MAAVEAGLTPEIREDFLTCTFCRLPFNQPKALPCLHTFCRTCLSLHVLKHAVPAQDGTVCIHCPVCQQLCDLPKEGVDHLPDNILMRSILAMINNKAQHICDPCTDDGLRKCANFCCTKCEDFMCEPCAITHKRTRATKEHMVLDIGCMKDLCRIVNQDQPGRPIINVRMVSKFGKQGTDMHDPLAITLNRADDVMVSHGNGTISLFANDGELKKVVEQAATKEEETKEEEEEEGEERKDSEKKPLENKGIAFTSEGYLAVVRKKEITTTNNNGQTVKVGAQVCTVQSIAGREISTCLVKTKSPEACEPHGIAITGTNHIIVSDIGKHCIYVFDPEYKLIKTFGKKGTRGSKEFKYPYYVATNSNKDIIVSDYGNHCVKVFQFNNLSCRLRIGGNGTKPGCFTHPKGVCADKFGNIFVADRDNHRVQMFDPRGQFLANILQDTYERGEDVRPLDIAMTSNSNLVVLLKGVEGVEFAQVSIYQLRATKVQAEQYKLEQERLRLEEERRKAEEEQKRLEEEKKKAEEEEKKRLEEEEKKKQEEEEKQKLLQIEKEKKENENKVEDLLATETKSNGSEKDHNDSNSDSSRSKSPGPETIPTEDVQQKDTEVQQKNSEAPQKDPEPEKKKKPKKKKSSKKKEESDTILAPKTGEVLQLPPVLTKRPLVLPPIGNGGANLAPLAPASSSGVPGRHTVQPDVVLQSIAESIIFDPDKNGDADGEAGNDKSKDKKGKSKDKPSSAGSNSSRSTGSTDKKKDPSQVCTIL